MGFQPGLPGSQFPSEDALIRRIQDLEKTVQQLAAANPFAPMGMSPTPGGVNVTGNLSVTGTLSLPNGIINNDALANPITGAVSSGNAKGFALPGSSSPVNVIITKTVPVPAGFTKALVLAYTDMTASNPTASGDYYFVRVKIAGVGPTYMSGTYVPAGQYCYNGSNFSQLLTGLGASFDVTVEVGANTVAWAANDINFANLSAMVTFLR